MYALVQAVQACLAWLCLSQEPLDCEEGGRVRSQISYVLVS